MTPTPRSVEAAKRITVYCENNYPVGPKNWYSEIEPLIASEIEKCVQESYEEGRRSNAQWMEQKNKEWREIGRKEGLEDSLKVIRLIETNHFNDHFRNGFYSACSQIGQNIQSLKEKKP